MVQVGYYPGQPIPRAPKAGKPPPPPSYDFDVISKWIDQTFRDVDFGRLPKAIKDDIVRDIERQLKLSAQPKKADYDVQRALEYGEINETPGVQLQLNVNPKEWLEDPGKQLEITAKSWQKSVFNWDDLRNYVEKKYFWEPVLAGRDTLAPEGTEGFLKSADNMAQKILGNNPSNELQPYQLHDVGVMKAGDRKTQALVGAPGGTVFYAKDRDVYNEVGQKVLKFIDGVDNANSRNAAIHDLRYSAVEAAAEELKQASALTGVAADSKKAIENFNAGQQVLDSMRFVRSGPTGKNGLSLTSSSLGKIISEGVGGVDSAGHRIGAVTNKGEKLTVSDSLKKLWDSADNAALAPGSTVRATSDLGKALNTLKEARAKMSTPQEIARFDQLTAGYKKKVTEIQKLVEENLKKGNAIENVVSARALRNSIDRLQKDFLDSNPLSRGLEFKFGELMEGSLVSGRDVFGNTNFKAAVKDASDHWKTAGNKSGIDNATRILNVTRPTYERNDLADFLENAQDGKLMQRYVWPKAREYFESFTPAKMLGEQIKRTHSFGMVYDPDMMEANARRAGHYFTDLPGGVPQTMRYSARFDKWARRLPKNIVKLDLEGLGKVSFEGGKHFEGALNLQKLITTKSGGSLLHPLATGNLLGSLNAELTAKGAFARFTDGGKSFLNLLNHGERSLSSAAISAGGEADDLAKWFRQSKRFKAWLYLNKDKLGLKFTGHNLIEDGVDGASNSKIVGGLLQKLSDRENGPNISALWERAGRLQILASWAQKLQTAVYSRIGKYLAPFIQVKNAIANAVSSAVAKILTQGLAVASGGLAELLSPLIEKIIKPIVKFLTNFLLNRLESLGKAILHGDISVFVKEQEKLANAVAKGCLFFFGIPVFLIALIVFSFFGATLTTMPVVDPTRGGGFYVGEGFRPPGEGNWAGCGIPEYTSPNSGGTTIDCFKFMDSGGPGSWSFIPWPEANLATFRQAIQTIGEKTGHYLDRLCSAGDVYLYRAADAPGWCGNAYAGRKIVFLSTCTYTKQEYVNFLLAHESAHIYAAQGYGGYETPYDAEGSMPTYPIYATKCSGGTQISEAFADAVGNWVQVNTCDCAGVGDNGRTDWESFWNYFPRHKEWGETFFAN